MSQHNSLGDISLIRIVWPHLVDFMHLYCLRPRRLELPPLTIQVRLSPLWRALCHGLRVTSISRALLFSFVCRFYHNKTKKHGDRLSVLHPPSGRNGPPDGGRKARRILSWWAFVLPLVIVVLFLFFFAKGNQHVCLPTRGLAVVGIDTARAMRQKHSLTQITLNSIFFKSNFARSF